jgi:DNA helicase II / ATP-dependent DNA helicase PcrA
MLHGLNDAQRLAVEHVDGPLLIIAGAGTGKTRTITERIVQLIRTGVAPDEILAITFTNKAAKEMRERVLHLLANDPSINRPVDALATGMTRPFMSTFHSLGVSLLREFSQVVGLHRHFTIYDRAESMRAVKEIIVELGYDPKTYEPRQILSIISRTKGDGHSYEHLVRDPHNPWKTLAGAVMRLYDLKLSKEHALDFDDLLSKTAHLLLTHPEVREILHRRWRYIHIDEYQDTNAIQFQIAQLLTGPGNNICAVGDTDQLIYSWRGAQLENLLSFEKEFPNTTVIVLEENYRSTQRILDAANAVIAKNSKRKEKQLFTKNVEGAHITLHQSYTGDDEARYVAESMRTLIEEGVAASEIAVLYRANFLSRALEDACLRHDVPYQVLGTRFFERQEVKDVISYVRAAQNTIAPGDYSRAASTPPRGIGKTTLAKVLMGDHTSLTPALRMKVEGFESLLDRIRHACTTLKPSDVITFVIQESGLDMHYKKDTEGEERIQNMRELVTLATKYDNESLPEGIMHFLDDAALAADQDSLEVTQSTVKLMTIHAAKGLEFEHVFLVGLEQGVFPSDHGDEHRDEEEERRLMYVAITRARKVLHLSYAMMRTIYGQTHVTVPSEFISDIPQEHIYSDERSSGSRERGPMDLIDF